MKLTLKKGIVLSALAIVTVCILIWCAALAKNRILTAKYESRINEIQFSESDPLPEFDWYRVTSYSDEEITIYYVDTVGKDTQKPYKIGGTVTCYKKTGGWNHTDITNGILWSGAGSADHFIWPYWYHIFRS